MNEAEAEINIVKHHVSKAGNRLFSLNLEEASVSDKGHLRGKSRWDVGVLKRVLPSAVLAASGGKNGMARARLRANRAVI